MNVLPVVYTVLQIFPLIAMGVLIRKHGSFGASFFRNLSRFVVRIAIPLYVFTRISMADVKELSTGWIFIAASAAVTFTGFSLGWAAFSLFRVKGMNRKAGLACSAFGNSGYFAISLTEIAPVSLPFLAERMGFGAPLLYIGAYLIIHNILLWTFGNYMITGRSGSIRLKEFLNPPLIGILAGFTALVLNVSPVVGNQELPWFYLFNALEALADITMPLVLVCLGSMIADLNIRETLAKGILRVLFPVSLVRFVLLPGVFYLCYFLLFKPLGFSPAILWVLFLETHTPPALNFSVMTVQAGANEELSSSILLGTYTIYLFLLPAYLLLFLFITGIVGS